MEPRSNVVRAAHACLTWLASDAFGDDDGSSGPLRKLATLYGESILSGTPISLPAQSVASSRDPDSIIAMSRHELLEFLIALAYSPPGSPSDRLSTDDARFVGALGVSFASVGDLHMTAATVRCLRNQARPSVYGARLEEYLLDHQVAEGYFLPRHADKIEEHDSDIEGLKLRMTVEVLSSLSPPPHWVREKQSASPEPGALDR